MYRLLIISSLFACASASAVPIVKIEAGDNYQNYTNDELRRRIWNLERAVAQLQQRVFQLESSSQTTIITPAAPVDTWVCTVKGFSQKYSATGASKAVASSKAANACQTQDQQNGFFCKDPQCSQ